MKKWHFVGLTGIVALVTLTGIRHAGACTWGDVVMCTWLSLLLSAALL